MRCRRWTQSLHLASRNGLAGMSCQRLLLFGKRHGRRRRRFPGDDLSICNRRRRGGHVTRGRAFSAEHAFAGWSDSNSPT